MSTFNTLDFNFCPKCGERLSYTSYEGYCAYAECSWNNHEQLYSLSSFARVCMPAASMTTPAPETSPRLSPPPGHRAGVARLAAAASAAQVGDTVFPVDVPESETLWLFLSGGYSLSYVRSGLVCGIPHVEQEAQVILDRVQKAWAQIRSEVAA